jgi:hypothetical protein
MDIPVYGSRSSGFFRPSSFAVHASREIHNSHGRAAARRFSIDVLSDRVVLLFVDYREENREQNTLMKALLDRISEEEWNRSLNGGWTVGTMLCHLAFWDQMTLERLKAYRKTGSFAPVPDAENIDAVNSSVRLLAASIPLAEGVNLVRSITDAIDEYVAGLTTDEIEALKASGRDRWFRRGLHRQHHLQKLI